MSERLTADLRSPGRGLARWGWLERRADWFRRICRITSPDGSVEIKRTASGHSLRRVSTASAPGEETPFYCSPGPVSTIAIKGGYFEVGGYASTIADASLSTGASDGYACLLLELGWVSPPAIFRFVDGISVPSEASLTSARFVFASADELAAASYFVPSSMAGASIYIPLALKEGGLLHPFWFDITGIVVSIYHGYFYFRNL